MQSPPLPRMEAKKLPSHEEVKGFEENVDEVARLIEGLRSGTLPPSYVDSKIEAKDMKRRESDAKKEAKKKETSIEDDPQRKAELMQKVEEIRRNQQRKKAARGRFEHYLRERPANNHQATDYHKWDMWCPSDEEDDLVNSITPNTPEFRAMEKDINDRHSRMVEQRQVAERARVAGNKAMAEKQWCLAYSLYEPGLDAQRHNMALHCNAALASIKMQCYAQAIEHCDKVLHIAEFLHNDPRHPLCVKALQRRAAARTALGHHAAAVADLEEALRIVPADEELRREQRTAVQQRQEEQALNSLSRGASGDRAETDAQLSGDNVPLAALREVEALARQLQGICEELGAPSWQELGRQPPETLGAEPQLPKGLGAAGELGVNHSRRGLRLRRTCLQLTQLLGSNELLYAGFRRCGGLDACLSLATMSASTDKALERRQPPVVTKALLFDVLCACCSNLNSLVHISRCSVLLRHVRERLLKAKPGDGLFSMPTLLTVMSREAAGREAVAALLAEGEGAGFAWLLQSAELQDKTFPCKCLLPLLSNCALTRTGLAALERMLAAQRLAPLPELLALPVADALDASTVEAAAVALGNLCSSAKVRRAALREGCSTECTHEEPGLLSTLLQLATVVPAEGSQTQALKRACADMRAAALTALCNLLSEPQAQVMVVKHQGWTRISNLLPHAADAQQRYKVLKALALLAKQPASFQQASEHAAASPEALQELLIASPTDAGVGDCQDRIVLALASWGGAAELQRPDVLDRLAPPAVLEWLLAALQAGCQSSAAAGNIALLLSHVAGHGGQSLKCLRRMKAVEPLLQVVRTCDSDSARRNAGIAIARLAEHPPILSQLRQLRGLEMLYEYVRP